MGNRIVSVDIIDGELIVTYQDGSTESLGPVAELDPEELSAAVLKNAGDIVDLKRAVSALQTSVTALDTAVGAAETSIDSLEAEVGAIKNDLSEFPNGNYPQMGAGYANQLVSGLKKEDQTPYNFRSIPYDATLEEVKKIVGGTVAWNQLCNNAQSITYNAGEQKDTSVCTFDAVSGHKYLFSAKQSATLTSNERNTGIVRWADNTRYYENANANVNLNAGTRVFITTCTATGSALFSVWVHTPSADVTYSEFQITDLTQDFGTSIADYVYNLETATAGAGAAWLKTHFPKQFDAGYQAYDAGTLKSIEGLTAHQTVADGVTHSYALDSDVVLRGIPKLDSNNALYYDGDEYLPDGTVNRRYEMVVVSADDVTQVGTASTGVPWAIFSLSREGLIDTRNALSTKYLPASGTPSTGGWFRITGSVVYVYDNAITDLSVAKALLDGLEVLYPLATPTAETADPYTTPQIISPDGTEEYIYEDSAFELPVGHSSEYPVDVSGQLDDILDTPSANGTYVLKATVTDGAVTYSWVADA